MSKSEVKKEVSEFEYSRPEEKKKNGMKIETFLHITGVVEHNKAGLLKFAEKFANGEKKTFEEWKEFFKKY